MIKTTDVPPFLRDFNKAFNNLTGHGRHDTYTLFSDFVDYCLNYLLLDESAGERQEEIFKRYPGNEQEFHTLLQKALEVMQNMLHIADEEWGWFDVFGTYYEILASSSKRSGFGQFFTPQGICNLMAHITGPITGNSMVVDGLSLPSVNDPACGSGRTLLAANMVSKGRIVAIGYDLDPICAKMTAINLAWHGVRGEVVCMDTLRMDDFRFAYQVNVALSAIGKPHIIPRPKDKTISFGDINKSITPQPEQAEHWVL